MKNTYIAKFYQRGTHSRAENRPLARPLGVKNHCFKDMKKDINLLSKVY